MSVLPAQLELLLSWPAVRVLRVKPMDSSVNHYWLS